MINATCKDTLIVFEPASTVSHLEWASKVAPFKPQPSQEYLTVTAPPRPRHFTATGAKFPLHPDVVHVRI